MVPDGIRPSVVSLFDRCQKAYGVEEIPPKEVSEALEELDKVLNYYFTGEMEAWRL